MKRSALQGDSARLIGSSGYLQLSSDLPCHLPDPLRWSAKGELHVFATELFASCLRGALITLPLLRLGVAPTLQDVIQVLDLSEGSV